MLVDTEIDRVVEYYAQHSTAVGLQPRANVFLETGFIVVRNDNSDEDGGVGEENLAPPNEGHVHLNNNVASIYNGDAGDYPTREVSPNQRVSNNDNDNHGGSHNNSDGNAGNNGDQNNGNSEDNGEVNNENHASGGNNDNSNDDNNDKKNNGSNLKDNDDEGADNDVDDEENTEDEDISNIDRFDDGANSSIKTYLVNKLPFSSDDFNKEDSKLLVTSTSSILSNTPYDSIEASHKLNVPNEIYHSNHINFRMKSSSNDFVELINITGNSLSDEFSGTESMEYIHDIENEKLSDRFENRYTNLITITQGTVDKDIHGGETDVSYNKPLTTANIDSSEVHVITGNDTLSAVICLEEGLADDDSWVEELDRDDFATEESSESEDFSSFIEQEEVRRFNRCDIDFTLHTIVEESGEDSDVEEKENTTTQLEKYFVFEIGGTNINNSNEDDDTVSSSNNGGADLDSISESSSTISETVDMLKVLETPSKGEKSSNGGDLAPSRLEKYFLSGFMGFNKRDSDGSVGSDSEGKHSPEQRRKKLVRARGTARHSSQDNLNEEQQINSESYSESSDTDAVDTIEEHHSSFEKSDGQFDTVKRMKKKKRSVGVPSIEHLESCCENSSESKKFEIENGHHELSHCPQVEDNPISISKDLSSISVASDAEQVQSTNNVVQAKSEKTNNLLAPIVNNNLARKDSFNNWSSDEETNLMMSKMRSFFKSMIANQRSKNASPVIKTRNKPPQLVYFEAELTRLMKTVPGIRDDQVKEIVEYLSSEDTWSDSYDSSDYTSSDLEIGSKKGPFCESISVEHCKVPDMCADGSKTDSDLVYRCLMSSFQQHAAVEGAGVSSDSSASRCSPPLMNKVMQHIGSRLVALMHEVTEGSAGAIGAGTGPKAAGRYHRRMQPKLPTICTTTEEEDDSLEECSPLPRSKSYDPLLEESRQECSDNERFSWRGSFESALMTGSDSRTRLPSAGEASASALALAAAKRRSAGDLLFKSGNNSREHLDRVRSCGSIGGGIEDKIWSLRHPRKRRSSVPEAASNSGGESADGENDSDDEEVELRPHESSEEKMSASGENLAKSTTLPRTLQTLNISSTNSLPRLSSSVSPTTNIYKVNSSHQFGVKSARYRPPGYNSRMNPGSYATLCAPPRRDYIRRRQGNQDVPSPSISVLNFGTGDNCSVASDISDRTGILDNESEKSPSRASTVTVTRSDSMASVYSGAGEGRYGIVPIRGEVEFSLQYNYKAGDVEIHVKRCSDLAPVDIKRNRSDPYVKVYLLPDKSKSGKRKTRVKKHTLNPVFDEILKYHVTLEELKSRTLWLSVWHSDIFGRNDFLGEVIIPLENKIFDDPLPKLYVLKERSEVPDSVSTFKGDLIVALKFVLPLENKLKNRATKELGSLHVLVKEAKNLTAIKSSGTSDPFCKSYLLPNKGRSCKQKTPVLKRTCNPVWNHTFVYNNVTLDEMSQRCLELTIWDHDRLASNEFLGGVRLSLGTGLYNDKSVDWMDSNNREIALWQRMINHPNFWVESSLILRPSLDMRSKN